MNEVATLLARLAAVEDRIAKTVMQGTIAEVDAPTGTARVQSGELLTGWLPYAIPVMSSTVIIARTPAIGEQAIVCSPNGETDNGVIILGFATNNGGITDIPPGELRVITNANVSVTATGNATVAAIDATIEASGNATVTATGDATITAGGDATITADGDVAIDGDVINITATPITGRVNINGSTQQCLGSNTPCYLTGTPHLISPLNKVSLG
ncbi:MAG: phage baseplate assembly protein V [Alphaproteobacteria bacterium]|nr:phage baseplate assembly protein V [Alphaproteobacteria bacterium]